MLTASEVQEQIASLKRRVQEGMREHANDIANVRQGMAAARELMNGKLEAIKRSRDALDKEENDIIDDYLKKENDYFNSLSLIEQALRPDIQVEGTAVESQGGEKKTIQPREKLKLGNNNAGEKTTT